jgi:hypothetical protein
MMTEAEFEQSSLATGISDDILAYARRVLVYGESSTVVAAAAGLSPQRVRAACKRIRLAFSLLGGWIGAPVILPLGMHDDLNDYGRLLRDSKLEHEMLAWHAQLKERIKVLLLNESKQPL